MPSYRTLIVNPKDYPRAKLCDNCKHFGKFHMQISNGKWSYQMCGRCMCKGGKFNNHILAADECCRKHEWSQEGLDRIEELNEQLKNDRSRNV